MISAAAALDSQHHCSLRNGSAFLVRYLRFTFLLLGRLKICCWLFRGEWGNLPISGEMSALP